MEIGLKTSFSGDPIFEGEDGGADFGVFVGLELESWKRERTVW